MIREWELNDWEIRALRQLRDRRSADAALQRRLSLATNDADRASVAGMIARNDKRFRSAWRRAVENVGEARANELDDYAARMDFIERWSEAR